MLIPGIFAGIAEDDSVGDVLVGGIIYFMRIVSYKPGSTDE